jgi:DNA-binding CsgD family transcriptional regulator
MERIHANRLVERASEREGLVELCAGAAGAEGRGAVLLGEPGVGKTALLREAQPIAAKAEVRVLAAEGSEIERSYAFGLVRQLLGPVVLDDEGREELLGGPSSPAARLLLGEEGDREAEADPDFNVLHGLYWVFANLARRRPLLVCVDDAQWGDVPSLRFLRFLIRRLEGSPIALLLAARTGDAVPPVDDLLEDERSLVLRPRPLSPCGVAELASAHLAETPSADLADACWRVTGGNPFYLTSLLAEVGEGSIAPDGIGERSPEAVTRSVERRLEALPQPAPELAEAIAVLGDGCEKGTAAALAGLDPGAAADAAAELARAGILAPGPRLTFAHPIVRTAVDARLRPSRAAALHAHAAELLGGAMADPEEVAAHLIRTEPPLAGIGAALLPVAERALARGAPEIAVACLERVLAEDLEPGRRAEILVSLGAAEGRSGMPTALGHLEAATRIASDPATVAAAAAALGWMLYAAGRGEQAVEVLARTATRIAGEAPELGARLEGEVLMIADLDLAARRSGHSRVAAVTEAAPGDASGAGHLAVARLMAADDAAGTAALAESALGDPALIEGGGAGAQLYFLLVFALMVAERFETAGVHIDLAVEGARAQGSAIAFATSLWLRGHLACRLGRLAEAEADARIALEVARLNQWPPIAQTVLTVLGDALIERGEPGLLDEAAALAGIDLDRIDPGTQGTVLQEMRGRARLAGGDLAGGVEDLLEAGGRLSGWGARNPALYGWQMHAALGLATLGEAERARELADEQLRLARAWGAPRCLALALRTAALLERGEAQVGLLEEAAETIAGSPATLARAQVLADLGAALRRGNRRAEAREPLREALELARACGAEALTRFAGTELWATGDRPRTPTRTGADALTPSELRIARLADSGLSNAEIAQSLFVTVKTVEMHLTRAYRKLDVGSRRELGGALPPEDAGPPAQQMVT